MGWRICGRTVGTTLVVAAICAACARAGAGLGPAGSDDDASAAEGATDARQDADAGGSTSPSQDGAIHDSTGAGDPGGDAATNDTGASAETGPTETGPEDAYVSDGSTVDEPYCPVGAVANYQETCTGCSISATCLLTCSSCTTAAQMQNPNPNLQLPCPSGESVQNVNGVLKCTNN